MHWERYVSRPARIEDAFARIRLRLVPPPATVAERVGETVDELRLFPIVAMDVCYPVASLLSRGKLEEAAALLPDRCWVASTPLYG